MASSPIDACEREPIHVPGSVQPHGALLAVREPGLEILQASANLADVLGLEPAAVLGRPLGALIGGPAVEALREAMHEAQPDPPRHVGTLPGTGGRRFDLIAHRHDGLLIVELDPAVEAEAPGFAALHRAARAFVERLQRADDVAALGAAAAIEFRRLLGFDRVLVYRFDADWNGHVIAEDRNDALPSYLGLRFPASDIPAQARELYRLNRVRLIPDAGYRPAPLVPALRPDTGAPLDLGFAALRSVSPVHLEYMRNMGTAASMSISLMVGDRLWGLVSCHHATPRHVPFELRSTGDHLGQLLALQIEAKQEHGEARRRLELRGMLVELLASLAESDDFAAGLMREGSRLLQFGASTGAAILHDGRCLLLGDTPGAEAVSRLAEWLSTAVRRQVHATDCLSEALPEAAAWSDCASGLLAVSISQIHRDYVMWFRPEVVRVVSWGGDPNKAVQADGAPAVLHDGVPRLHPRRSFEAWKETVRRRSLVWRTSEIDAAIEFRGAIVGVVLRQAEELAQLAGELRRANGELEAFSYSVSHDLRAPLRHIAGYTDLLRELEGERLTERGRRFLDNVAESARYAGTLVDNLLTFSQMGRAALHHAPVDLNLLVDEAIEQVCRQRHAELQGRRVEWSVERPLPVVSADAAFLRLVLENLLDNAIKYTRGRDPARIAIGSVDHAGEHEIRVRDNGVGFDDRYAHKLFGVFQRLHRMEDFEGTGIGLANVRRIVSRHGGRTWAEGRPEQGATFHFTLPR